jgi:Cu/Ag efflux protein CusF
MKAARALIPMLLLLCAPLVLTACSSSNGPKPRYHEEGTSSVNATVQAIDYPTRVVTLKSASGNALTLTVDDRVKNLERIKVGDHVKAKYLESVDIQVREPGDAAPAVAHIGDVEEGPDGSFKRQSTITAVVEQVERKKGIVVLSGPAGNLHAFRVRDPRKLENVKVGDEVVATYREDLAVAIERADGGAGK